MVSADSTVVEHSDHHLEVNGLSPQKLLLLGKKTAKKHLYYLLDSGVSTLAEHLPHHPKINGLNPAEATGIEILKFYSIAICR